MHSTIPEGASVFLWERRKLILPLLVTEFLDFFPLFSIDFICDKYTKKKKVIASFGKGIGSIWAVLPCPDLVSLEYPGLLERSLGQSGGFMIKHWYLFVIHMHASLLRVLLKQGEWLHLQYNIQMENSGSVTPSYKLPAWDRLMQRFKRSIWRRIVSPFCVVSERQITNTICFEKCVEFWVIQDLD